MYVSRVHCSPLPSLASCESSYPAPSFSHWCLRLQREWERLKVTQVVAGEVQITSSLLTSEVAGICFLSFLNMPAWLVWQRLLFAYAEYPFSLIYYRVPVCWGSNMLT